MTIYHNGSVHVTFYEQWLAIFLIRVKFYRILTALLQELVKCFRRHRKSSLNILCCVALYLQLYIFIANLFFSLEIIVIIY